MDWSEISGDAHFISGFQLCGLHVTASAVSIYHALITQTVFYFTSFVFYCLVSTQYTVMLKYTKHTYSSYDVETLVHCTHC